MKILALVLGLVVAGSAYSLSPLELDAKQFDLKEIDKAFDLKTIEAEIKASEARCKELEPKLEFLPNGSVHYDETKHPGEHWSDCVPYRSERYVQIEEVREVMKLMPLQYKYQAYLKWCMSYSAKHEEGSEISLDRRTVYKKVPKELQLDLYQIGLANTSLTNLFLVSILARSHKMTPDRYLAECNFNNLTSNQCKTEMKSLYNSIEIILKDMIETKGANIYN